jgi:YjbE family integral membrane protein
MWGVVGAVGARIVLIFFALQLLALPYLKAVGALLLLWIGVKLILPEDEEGHGKLEGGTTLWSAVRTVIVADAVMSLDNVIAVAAAAGGSLGLVIFGIVVSVPIIVWGSKFVITLIERFPLVVVFGGGLLGWIAGGMLVSDVAWQAWYEAQPAWFGRAAAAAGALLVVAVGKLLAYRRRPARPPAAAPAQRAPGSIRRVLVAVDGSSGALHALREALALRAQLRQGEQVELHLLNVQRPLSGDVASFVSADSIEDYHRERAEEALAPARAALKEAGQSFSEHRRVGQPGEVIAEVAVQQGCDLIMMGARGLGTHTGALLGSVAASTLEHAGVPVLVVRN